MSTAMMQSATNKNLPCREANTPFFKQITEILGSLATPQKVIGLMQKRSVDDPSDKAEFREIASKLSKLPELLALRDDYGTTTTEKVTGTGTVVFDAAEIESQSGWLEPIKTILSKAGIAFTGGISELGQFLGKSLFQIYPRNVLVLEDTKAEEEINLRFCTSSDSSSVLEVNYKNFPGYGLAIERGTGKLLAKSSNTHTCKEKNHSSSLELATTA